MALKITTGFAGLSLKTAGVSFAVLAFFVQLLITLNISSVFAIGQPAETNITIRPGNLQGWSAVDDNGHGGNLSFVAGPATSPLGSGSAQLQVSGATQGYMLAKTGAYGGTKLADITTLDYSTYTTTGNNLWAPSLQLNVTPDVGGTAAWYGRLVYEPYMNVPGSVVSDGAWHTWNAASGKWWLSKPSSFGGNCDQSHPCTFAQLISHYPNIGINTGVYAGVGFKAGSAWSNYTGSIDDFHLVSATRNDRYDFERDLTAPTLTYPANNGYVTTNNFWFDWDDVTGAASYEWHGSTSSHTTSGVLDQGTLWDGDKNHTQPTASTIHSEGASGTWYWQVRAVDANGAKGPWSAVWKMTIDMTAPLAPTSLGWKTATNKVITDGGITNEYGGTASWTASTSADVDHYVYKYWNDIVGNPYKAGSEYAVPTTSTSLPGVFNQGDGVHHFCVAAVDVAGNSSACTTFTITYDSIAPSISGVGFGQNPVKDQLVVTGSVSDVNLKDYNLRVYNATHSAQVSPWTGLTGTTNVDNGTLGTLNVSALPEGDYYLRIWADDLAGNRAGIASQIFVPFRVDRTAPVIQVTSVSRNSDGTYTITGTTDDNLSDVSVKVGLTTLASVTPDHGTWTVTTGELSSGKYDVTASSTDGAGNTGSATLSPSLVVPAVSGPSLTASATTLPQLAVVPSQLAAQAASTTTQQATDLSDTQTDADQDSQVLGAQTTTPSGSDKVAAIVPSSQGWKLWGIAWYWWLIALAVIAGVWWLAVGLRRRKAESPVDF